eukprot:7716501-Lingulodinium_polyedra.AAC.1
MARGVSIGRPSDGPLVVEAVAVGDILMHVREFQPRLHVVAAFVRVREHGRHCARRVEAQPH